MHRAVTLTQAGHSKLFVMHDRTAVVCVASHTPLPPHPGHKFNAHSNLAQHMTGTGDTSPPGVCGMACLESHHAYCTAKPTTTNSQSLLSRGRHNRHIEPGHVWEMPQPLTHHPTTVQHRCDGQQMLATRQNVSLPALHW